MIDNRTFKAAFFDCFGTVFDISTMPKGDVSVYVKNVNSVTVGLLAGEDFSPLEFPESWWKLKAHRDAADGLRAIRKLGIKCFAMSNGSVELIEHISSANGIRWDGVIDFRKAKIYKPHPDAYRVAQTQTGILPADSLMVTANPTFGDVEGSQAIGMQCQLIRQGSYLETIIDLADLLSE